MLQDSIDLKCPEHAIPETESRLGVTRGWGRGKLGMTGNGCRVFAGDDEKVLQWMAVIFARL